MVMYYLFIYLFGWEVRGRESVGGPFPARSRARESEAGSRPSGGVISSQDHSPVTNEAPLGVKGADLRTAAPASITVG